MLRGIVGNVIFPPQNLLDVLRHGRMKFGDTCIIAYSILVAARSGGRFGRLTAKPHDLAWHPVAGGNQLRRCNPTLRPSSPRTCEATGAQSPGCSWRNGRMIDGITEVNASGTSGTVSVDASLDPASVVPEKI